MDVDVAAYQRDGFVLLPRVFSAEIIAGLAADVDAIAETDADTRAWNGPWVRDFRLTRKHTLVTKHQMHTRFPRWAEAVQQPVLCRAAEAVLRVARVTVREVTMVVKPPETGQPFPVHQDAAYYGHGEAPSVLAVVHLDDTHHENGALRFLPGAHTRGLYAHTTHGGKAHMDRGAFRIEDTVEVPARVGDVVLFSLYTPHASYPNRSQAQRRTARIWYQAA